MMPGPPHALDERTGPASTIGSTLCVFAVCRTGAFSALPSGTGHPEGGPVTLLALDDVLSAVVQDVPPRLFAEDALKQRLADRTELESCARAHHATVTAAAEHGPVVPLPLATLFTGADRARASLYRQLPLFCQALKHVQGRAEWAVKVYQRQRATRENPLPEPANGQIDDNEDGRAYLTRIRGRERDRLARRKDAADAATGVHHTASALAVDCVQRRPHGPEITGKERLQVMNAAYLVPHEQAAHLAEALRALTRDLAAADVDVEVSGPWVPYSFTGSASTSGKDAAGAGGAR